MFVHKKPYFNKGRILKREMLGNMRDFPRHILNVALRDYSNGVVCGADILVREDSFCISPGVIKYQDKLYILDENYTLFYGVTEQDVSIKVEFLPATETPDYLIGETKIFIDPSLACQENQMSLGLFKLKVGAWLRSDYQDLADFVTEYNTINIVEVPYAAREDSTLHPTVLRYFANHVLKCGCQNPYDLSFAMLCINSDRVERLIILHYIANRLGQSLQKQSNRQIHQSLIKILQIIEREAKRPQAARQREQKIWVD